MKDIPDHSIDFILTDPPYGIDYQSCRVPQERRKNKILNDKKPFTEFIPMIARLLKPTGACAIFTRWDVQQTFIDEMTENGLKPQNVLIWDKVQHGMGDLKRSFGSRYESILFHANHDFRFQGKRPTDIIRFQRVPASKLVHPNEKPIDLLEYLIEKCCVVGGGVLDPFMGSGTTCIAAQNLNRQFIGFELDPDYFNIAKQRIEELRRIA